MKPTVSQSGFAFVALLLVCGCADKPAAESDSDTASVHSDATPEKTALIRKGPFDVQVERYQFAVPKGWKQVELTERQQIVGGIEARFLIPAAGEEVELTISVMGGGIGRTTDYWKAQYPVNEPKVETIELGDGTANWIEYAGNLSKAAEKDVGAQRMIGVSIALPTEQDLYLKFVADAAVLRAISDDAKEFVSSATINTDQ